MKIFIESENALDQGDRLIKTIGRGTLSQPNESVRSLEGIAIVEILELVGEAAKIVGGLTTTAYQIWKWRQDIKKSGRVVLSKKEEDGEERLLLDKDTSKEEIERFLNREKKA